MQYNNAKEDPPCAYKQNDLPNVLLLKRQDHQESKNNSSKLYKPILTLQGRVKTNMHQAWLISTDIENKKQE